MNMQSLWIPGPLPGMNEIINAKASKFSKFRSAYTEMKKTWDERVALLAQAQSFKAIESGHFVYLWREVRKQRDPSNFTSGGRKLIEDGLQSAGKVVDAKGKTVKPGLLANDGWKQVLSFQDVWVVGADRPGVTVFVMDTKVMSPDEFWYEMEEERRNGK